MSILEQEIVTTRLVRELEKRGLSLADGRKPLAGFTYEDV